MRDCNCRATSGAPASAARTSDLSSRCRSRRGKTPNRREPRSRVSSHSSQRRRSNNRTSRPSIGLGSGEVERGPSLSGTIRRSVGWFSGALTCVPQPERAESMPRALLGAGLFLPVGSQFSEGTEKSIVTAITDLIEDWIQMRSTLQRQLKMLESSETYAGDKISDSTIGDTIVRVRRCIDELNSLLKEYAISPRR